MAALTDREIRMIQEIHQAVTTMSTAVSDIRNMTRSATQNDLNSALNDIRGTVNSIRGDASHVNQVLTNLVSANSNFAALQQFLMRIESNTQGATGVINHIEQIRNDVATLQQVLGNVEQFMSDVSAYVQDIQSQLGNLHAGQQQLVQAQQNQQNT